jgi:hypothetical protein
MLENKEKKITFEILDISYKNGERHTIEYDYRKKRFETMKDMEDYKKYLEKKPNMQLYLTFIDYDKESNNKV